MSRRNTGWLRARLSFTFVSVWLISGLSACDSSLDRTPERIQGHWITDDDLYADTSFEIGPNHLTMHLVPEAGGSVTHDLDRIEEELVGSAHHYVLSYVTGEGVEDALRVTYSEDPEPLLQFANRKTVLWRRAP